jgi:hypothetical protein
MGQSSSETGRCTMGGPSHFTADDGAKEKGPRSEHAALRHTTEVVLSLTRYDLTESARILD